MRLRSTCAFRRRLRRAPPARDAAVSGARRRVTRHRPLVIHLDSNGAVRRLSPIVQVGDRAIRSFSVATATGGEYHAGAERADRRSRQLHVMIPWRGPARKQQRPADLHVVFVLRCLLFAAADPGRAEARNRSRALQGSHRHRRRHRRRIEGGRSPRRSRRARSAALKCMRISLMRSCRIDRSRARRSGRRSAS